MAKAKKCPFCGSCNVSRTVGGWGEEGLGALIGFGLSSLASTVGLNHTRAQAVREFVPTQYKCKKCGRTFHITSVDGKQKLW